MNKIALILALSLTGCAQYAWFKPGSTQDDFNRDSYQCQSEAARTYPVAIVSQQITSGYTAPSQTNCSAWGNQMSCTTTPGQSYQGTSVPIDVNQGNRNNAARQCMYARGWQLRQRN